jgi:CcmD family protein
MIWLVLIFSACAVGIVVYTFKIGSRLEQTDREIAELRKRIDTGESGS